MKKKKKQEKENEHLVHIQEIQQVRRSWEDVQRHKNVSKEREKATQPHRHVLNDPM